MRSVRGSTRLLLVVVLVAAAALLAVSVLVLLDGEDDMVPVGDEGDVRLVPTGEVDPTRRRTRLNTDDELEGDDDGIYWPPGADPREPHGDIFLVTAESLRGVFEDRHWEEIRRQIGVLQRNGEDVPMDVVESLIGLLDAEETRIDAILALGDVRSDGAGQALAERAANLTVSPEARAAALDALATNGSKVALLIVQTIATDPNTDPALLRHACPALAGIGGQDAARTLVDLLAKNQDTRLEGMLVQALGKTSGAGDVLAQTMRQARDASDGDMALLVVRVARLHGDTADDALRLEIRRLVEDPASREFVEDENERLKLRGGALSAAAAIGGDMLDPVVRIARDDSDGLGNLALHSLRKARGDDAAVRVAPLLDANPDPRFQREVAVILGETRSFKATQSLLTLLDAEDQNTRHAAAYGLSLVRDPDAAKPLLKRLDTAGEDYALVRNIIDALGTIGANEALPKLRELRASEDPEWQQVRPYVRRAIARIESGNPDTSRLE